MSRLREAARLYWIVKGHIPGWLAKADEAELNRIILSYTQRLWGNNEIYLHEEGFEEAWEKFKET